MAQKRKTKNWLDAYLDFTEEQASPAQFHLWTALGLISSATLGNVYLDFQYHKLYPNLFIVLVAPPGVCKKSTCLSIGMSILQEIEDKPIILPQKLTPQYMMMALSRGTGSGLVQDPRARGLIYNDEIGFLFDKSTIRLGIFQALCSMYDGHKEFTYATVARGAEKLQDVQLALLGATTPKWVRTGLPADVVGEGFAARVFFIFQSSTDRKLRLPDFSQKYKDKRNDLVQDLNTMASLSGQFILSEESREHLEHVYAKMETEAVTFPEGMEHYATRRPVHLLKLAMLCSVARGNDLHVIPQDLTRAEIFLRKIEGNLEDFYRILFSTKFGENSEYILKKIPARKYIGHSDLLRKVRHKFSGAELLEITSTLEATGEIITAVRNRGVFYKRII